MSRAFVKEDDVGAAPVLPKLVSPLPPGARNYVTPGGARRLRAEATELEARRPQLSAAQASADAREELARLDQRLQYLQESLRTAEVVPAPAGAPERVQFGATVAVRDSKGAQSTYRIVGVDETDFDRNWVSAHSPIARALLNARVGEKVPFKFPSGKTELEILEIRYEVE